MRKQGRVGSEAPGLRVNQPPGGEPGIDRIGVRHDRRGVVRDQPKSSWHSAPGSPGGPITGNGVVPSSWQKIPQGGPMITAGDTTDS